ncbi:MopE-related protein [Xanthomarina sp. F2636L]|uniref:MopE-related protein n=1 Tax=Xanthomarina sp. F2636L TaxID=2996018 RepID=UPI00225E055A|nr:MopE-related protein [Xanthomarina sp. F2636L]MCX7551851.1 MopE-related protein [Xanthomarina sp. F2636L]
MKQSSHIKNKLFFALTLLLLILPNLIHAQTPTVPSSNLSFAAIDGNRFNVYFTRGDGAKRIIVARAGAPVTAVPVDGTDYLAGAFGTGNEIAPGEFVVYEGTGNAIGLTGFTHSTTYYLKIFEFNGSDFATQYLTTSYLEGNQATLTNPATQASNITFSNVLGSNMTVSWTNGSGTGRILIARANSPVDVEPQDLTNYNTYSAGFGVSNYEIGTGNYAVYGGGGGSSVNISNLEPNTTYYFALYEYNGSNGKIYLTSTSLTNPTSGAIADQITQAYPTINTNAMTFGGIDGNRFNFYINSGQRGNGEKRLVIVKQGSPVSAIPVDGYEYTANTAFGSGFELAPDEFVIYSDTGNIAHTLTNIQPHTTYYFKVYEYNGSGSSTYYLKTNDSNGDPVLEANQATLSYPTTQASNMTFSNVLGSNMTVSWTNGNGAGRILIARANSPVDVEPQDLTNYSNSSSGFGVSNYEIGTGNYVLYAGAGTSDYISNLEPNTTYHFALYEYNGSSGKVYLTSTSTSNPAPGATASQTTNAYPTINSSAMTFGGIDGNRFNFYLNSSQRGNGEKRVVIAKQGSPVTAVPVDGNEYTANTAFGNGFELAPDEFVVYSGSGNIGHTLTNLQPHTTYYFKVYEYNGSGADAYYLTTNDSNGDPVLEANQATLTYPTTQASNISFSNVLGTNMTVSWTNGNGAGRILIARANSPVDVEPQDLTNYNNSSSGMGVANYEIGSGNYVLYAWVGSSVNISNLEPNTTYHFALYEYNGSSGKVYLTSTSTSNPAPGATASQTTTSYPTINANNMTFGGIDGNRFNFYLNSSQRGNGEKRVVIAKQGSPVTAVPVDGNEYTANTAFGNGYELAPDEFVIYSGSGNIGHTFTNLQPHTVYYFKVFEFNGNGANTYYLVTDDMNGDPVFETSQATISYPTVQTNNIFINSKTTTSFNVNWTNGDGANRILIARANEPVDVEPQDLVNYSSYSGGYGNSSYEIGTGNYVLYAGAAISDNVFNLQPGTNYHFALFEYNGSSGKAYLRPGYTFEAETYGERPTIQVSNINFEDIGATSMLVQFARGNGSARLVIAKEGAPVDVEPSDFTTYLADASFGQGQELGTDNFVVYNGTGEEFQLTDLNLSSDYHFAFFEYAINQNGELYLTPGSTASQATPNPPTIICSNLTYSPPCDSDLILDWTVGNGEGRIVILSEAPLNAAPVNATNYTANFDYGFGDTIGNGYVIFKGSGQLVPPNLLQPLTSYYVNIYEYNGTEEDPIFNMTPLQGLIGDITDPNVVCNDFQAVLDANGNVTITAADIGSASSDNCGVVTSEIDISSFDCSNLGENQVTYTETDTYGNTSSCLSIVTVVDITAPSITSVSDFNVNPTSGCDFTIPDYTNLVTVTDNCSVNSLSQSPLAGTVISNHETTQEIVITATDASGNSNSSSFTITLLGTNTYYADVDGDTFGDLNNSILGCAVPIGYSENSLDCDDTDANIHPDATEIQCNGIDENCNGMADDVDSISPICQTQDISVELDETGFVSISATDIDNGSSDNCGIDTMEVSPSSFDESNVGENTVTLSITDFEGNMSQCTATVTVDDSTLHIVENDLESITSFPNPFHAEVTFIIPNKLQNNRFQILLFDISGKEIINTIKTPESRYLKISNLNSLQEGIYLFKVINMENGDAILRKLIKK